MEDVKEKAEEQKEKQDDKNADYWRQQASQNDANARREREARTAVEKEAGDTKAQLAQMELKLKSLETEQQQQSQYQKMDTDVVDPAVAKNIEALQGQIAGLTQQLTNQQTKITQYEQLEQKREEDRRYNDAVEQICAPLDKEFGKKYRSEARVMADKAVEDGTEKKPNTTLEAFLLHKKFYEQLSAKEAEKKTTSTDNGKSTKAIAPGPKKPGKMSDVLKEMKEKCKT